MRKFGTAIGFFCSLIGSIAFSEELKVGDSIMRVSAPKGFCELNKRNKADSSWLTSAANISKNSGLSLIVAYPDCRELDDMRKSGAFMPTKVFFSSLSGKIDKPPSEEVSSACNELRARSYSEKDKANMSSTVKEFANGNTQTDALALGVLDEIKGTVCYDANLVKFKTKSGDSTLVYLFALTYLNNNIVYVQQFTKYVDANSIPTALANLKIIYSDFAVANKISR